jgi:hypothetical protein
MSINTIKGHHGTDIDSCKAILKSNYKISKGDQHWLGDGVYFFIEGLSTDTTNLAEKWAIAEAWDNDNKRYKYTDFAVIESLIEVEEDKILDLTTEDGVNILSDLVSLFFDRIRKSKKNQKNKEWEFYDGELINMARKANNFPFDIEVIKGNYYIKFKEERIKGVNLRTSNCTICTVYSPYKNIKSKKLVKTGKIT